MSHGSKPTTVLSMLMLVMLIASGCDDSGPVSSDPHQPFIPADPTPTSGIDSESLIMPLAWSGGDPDGDPVVYDVYLGTTRLPELVAAGLTNNSFTTDVLQADETYFWRVVARDPDGNSISSPLWTFQTTVREGDFIFPSTIGNRWSYGGGYYYCNPTMDIIPEGMNLDTLAIHRVSEIVSLDTLMNGVEAYRITSTDELEQPSRGHYTYEEYGWFRDEADGQYLIASGPFGYGPQPHRPETLWPTMAPSREGLPLTELDPIDSYHLLDPPRKEIAYPVEAGKQWFYVNSLHSLVEKVIVGRTTIEVPAGVFECWEIRWLYQFGGDPNRIEMIDYVADIGLVAHYSRANRLEWYGTAEPDGSSGYVDHVKYYELEEYYVK